MLYGAFFILMDIQELYKIFRQNPQITIDSRQCPAGGIFFALKGEHADGNRYAADALKNGCAWAVVDDPAVVKGPQYIPVSNTLQALQSLAEEHRKHLLLPVIAITGTNGKTTTKELLMNVLSRKYKVAGTRGNLNNHIGLPLSLLTATPETEILVLEMGANHPGEIADLCRIARPTHGLITNIGKAHLEGFGSLERIIETKTALYGSLRSNRGTIFYHQEDTVLKKKIKEGDRTVSYGTGKADYRFGEPVADPVLSFLWKSPNGSRKVETQLYGKYNFGNVMAALTIGAYFGVEEDDILGAIKDYVPANMRSQILRTGKNTVILDAYNANPVSMKFAIGEFAKQPDEKKALILGDMAELGRQSGKEHRKILELIRRKGFSGKNVYLAGKIFYRLSKHGEYPAFISTGELMDYLKKNPLENYLILVKGSRLMQMEDILPVI